MPKQLLILCICLLLPTGWQSRFSGCQAQAMELTPAQQLDQAEELAKSGEFDQAEEIYKAVVAEEGPDALLAQEKLIDIYIQQNMQDEAETAYEQLLIDFADNPDLVKAIDHVADDWREVGDFEKAREVYQYIINTFPDADNAIGSQREVVRTSMLLGDSDYANESLDKLIKDYGNHSDIAKALESLASDFKSNGRYAKAREMYLYVVDNQPQSEYAVACLGGAIRTSFKLKDDPNAEALTQQLLSQYATNEDLPSIYDEVADEYRLGRKYTKARDLYRYAVTAWPEIDRAIDSRKSIVLCSIALNDEPNALADLDKLMSEFNATGTTPETADRSALLADALVKIANGYEQAKNFDQAKNIYQRMASVDPNSSEGLQYEIQNAKAEIFALIKDGNDTDVNLAVSKLIADYNNHPDFPTTLFDIAQEERYSEKHPQAIRHWKYVFDNYPKSQLREQIPSLLAVCYNIIGQEDTAIKYYKQTLEEFPNAPYAYRAAYKIASIYKYERIDFDKAIYWFEQQRQLYDNELISSRSLSEIGEIYICHLKDYKTGLSLCRQYLDEYPNSRTIWTIYSNIAICHEKLGDIDSAIESLRKAHENAPDDLLRTNISKRITRLEEGGVQ